MIMDGKCTFLEGLNREFGSTFFESFPRPLFIRAVSIG